jgi:WD40 repeat protein
MHNNSQVAAKTLYTASADRTARSWVMEYGDPARVFKGHEQGVTAITFHDGVCML